MWQRLPYSLKVVGNIDRGKRLIGIAKSQINILRNFMKYQGLKQCWRTYKVDDHNIIEMMISHGRSAIKITSLPFPEEEILIEGKKEECFCNPCLAMAKIISRSPVNPDDSYTMSGYKMSFELEICSQKEAYMVFDIETHSSSAEYLYPGQLVLIAVDAGFLNCTLNTSECLSDHPDFEEDDTRQFVYITPLIMPEEEMKEWMET